MKRKCMGEIKEKKKNRETIICISYITKLKSHKIQNNMNIQIINNNLKYQQMKVNKLQITEV